MSLSRLLSVPAFALRTTAVTAAVLSRIAEDAATKLATPTGTGPSTEDGPDILDLSGGAGTSYGAARQLARSAPDLAEMSDGAAAEARLKGGKATDATTAGGDEQVAAPEPTVPARDNAPAFDPARITSKPVREAIRAIELLSTEELRAVFEHETANRNRKTILRAVEQSLTTPAPIRSG